MRVEIGIHSATSPVIIGYAITFHETDPYLSGFRFVYEINGVWEFVKQSAAHIFIDDRKAKRTIGNAP